MTWSHFGLAMAVGLTAYLLGRRKVLIICVSASLLALSTLLVVSVYRATHRQPVRPVQLTLELARQQWRLNEKPWYLLRMKNVGYKSVTVQDEFWAVQTRISQNNHFKQWTYFEIVDPDGKPMSFFSLEWGMHGEFKFWANDCGGKICEVDDNRNRFLKELKRGDVLTATPSVVAPLRKGRGWLADARIPTDATQEERKAYQQLWKVQQSDMEHLTGAPKYQANPFEPPKAPLYPGYRVLEGYHFRKTGRYRMKVIYQPISQESAEEDIRTGLHQIIGLGGLPPETRIYRYESNEVEFEVVP